MLITGKIRQLNPNALRLSLMIALVAAACSQVPRTEPQAESAKRAPEGVRTVEIGRAVRIPVANDVESAAAGEGDPAKLTVSLGRPDELPEGPDGFDVTGDGYFLITDPLRKRIAVFDSNGAYRSEWRVGFAADSVTVLSGNLVQVREARPGAVRLFDKDGKPAAGSTSQEEPAEARLTGPDAGVVTWRAASGQPGRPLGVKFEKSGLKLLSLQGVAMDSAGDTYVAIESTAGGDAVDVKKIVRRYSADGRAVSETTDLPVDYFVRPTDEIRIHNGTVYQLMTTKSEVRINTWNTNS